MQELGQARGKTVGKIGLEGAGYKKNETEGRPGTTAAAEIDGVEMARKKEMQKLNTKRGQETGEPDHEGGKKKHRGIPADKNRNKRKRQDGQGPLC